MILVNREGEPIPQVSFPTIKGQTWSTKTTEDIFAGKKVVVFSLPGAFTPTCSSTHLPRYEQLTPRFKANGIDSVVCVSVNDTFVMNSWAKDQGLDNVELIPDGNGEFSAKMGMLVDKDQLGFGKRSWRYSMYVEDGIIKKMFIEPDKHGDPFEVSDADTMFEYLFPNERQTASVAIMTREGCPHCARAKQILDENGYPYRELTLGDNFDFLSLQAISGHGTVPQVFINGQRIGGADELEAHFAAPALRS